MSNLLIILEKIFFLLALLTAGGFAGKFKLIGDDGERDLSRLLVDFFWPAAIFSSITSGLKPDATNVILPFTALITAFVGLGLGFLAVGIFKFKDDRKKVFLYHSSINNFVFMAIPFVSLFYGERGLGLLFLHNLGYILFLWTFGVGLLHEKQTAGMALKRMVNPGLIATFLGILFVVFGIKLPPLVSSVFDTMGAPTTLIAMIVAGNRIYKLGIKVLKFDVWNIALGLIRLILVPALLFIPAYFLRPYIDVEVLGIFMIVNVMPVSVNSISLAKRYGVKAGPAAEGLVFTHLFGIGTMAVYLYFIKMFFAAA